MPDHLADAAAAHEADVDRLAQLYEDQLYYLANLREVKDPLSDGIEHDYEEHV